MIPKINSAHGSDTRNILNRAIDLINAQGKSIQDLVAEGQLTEEQYAQLVSIVNGNVKKGSITAADIDKNNFQLDQTHLSDELKQQIAGTAEINAVPANKSITTDKLADKSVTPKILSFSKPSRNIFDGNYVKGNMGMDSGNMRISLLESFSSYVAIIPIEPNETYTIKIHETELSDVFRVGVHNSEIPTGQGYMNMDTFIFQSNILKQHTFTNDANGQYLAVQTASSSIRSRPLLQVEKGEVATEYIDPFIIGKELIEKTEGEGDTDFFGENPDTIFKNTFTRRGQGTEKVKITNLINPRNENVMSNVAVTRDYDNVKSGDYSLSINVPPDATNYIERTIPEAERIESYHTLGISFYQSSVNDDDVLTLQLIGENGSVNVPFSETHLNLDGRTKENGWNMLRVRADYSNNIIGDIGKVSRVRFIVLSRVGTTFSLDEVWVESFDKAKMVFIHDGGYQEFFNKGQPGYYDLENRNVPVVIASIPNKIYDESNTRFISGDFLRELSLVNNNEISIHSFDGEDAIATMTPEEMYQESLNAVRMLRDNGHEVMWRAAFFRNNAPGASGAVPLFDAFAFNQMHSMIELIEGFPFVAPYNVRRFQLHARTNQTIDEWFSKLKISRGVWVVYTHNVEDDSSGDISHADWQYFLSKLDVALSEGWLEGATFKSLISAYN